MVLERLNIMNYRNIAAADLAFSPQVNCFVGANGMGKSNVLDAIYYLSFCRGFAGAQDALNVHHDADFFLLQANYSQETGVKREVCVSLKRGARKRLKVDGKDVRRVSEHVGQVPLVMIAPSDAALIQGGSEERRKFMDMVIMQYDAAYLDALIRYESALKQRNVLLRADDEPDAAVLDVLEQMMADYGQTLFTARTQFIEAFVPLFCTTYKALSGCEHEQVSLTYESHLQRGPLGEQLRSGRVKERIVGYTLHGAHKDELSLLLNGYAVKKEGSQGQQKTYLIAMKLAQYDFLRSKGEQRVPLLLLDDIFDKLDATRVKRIVDYVGSGRMGQIFITDPQRPHLDEILAMTHCRYKLFEVEHGQVSEVASDAGGEAL